MTYSEATNFWDSFFKDPETEITPTGEAPVTTDEEAFAPIHRKADEEANVERLRRRRRIM